MSNADFIQLVGAIVAFLVISNEIIKRIQEWRGGSPELRLLDRQLASQNESQLILLRDIASLVNRVVTKVGA